MRRETCQSSTKDMPLLWKLPYQSICKKSLSVYSSSLTRMQQVNNDSVSVKCPVARVNHDDNKLSYYL